MADRRDRKGVRLRKPDTSAYEVGYRKPPAETRFKPGQSGNPRGRPKGSKRTLPQLNEERLKAIILEEAYRTISVRDGERSVIIPMIQAVIRSLALAAAKGSQRSQRMFTELLKCVERDNKELHDTWLQAAIEYKFDWECELERRRRLDITGPEPLPHPDEIVIDMSTGTVEIKGPMTKEEKIAFDRLRQRKAECDEELAYLERRLRKDPDNRVIEQDMARERRLRALIAKVIPD